MNKNSYLFWMIFGIIFISLLNCDNSSTDDDNGSDYLFTANFINDWPLDGSDNSILFLSDENGDVIADTTIFGYGTVDFDYPEEYPTSLSEISVTTVIKITSPYTSVLIHSYLNIQPSEWTWDGDLYGYRGDPLGNATLHFSNIPDHVHRFTSYCSAWSCSSSPLASVNNVEIIDDCGCYFIRLVTPACECLYKWLTGLEAGQDYFVDLSDMDFMTDINIELPGEYFYNSFLAGFPDPAKNYGCFYCMDDEESLDSLCGNIMFKIAPSLFQNHYTNIIIRDTDPNNGGWRMEAFTDVPEDFVRLDADLEILNSSMDSCCIQHEG